MTEPFHETPTPCDWLVVASFWVAGEPKGQPRPKVSARGNFARVYDDLKNPAFVWKDLLFLQSRQHVPALAVEGPVRVWIDAYFSRPKALDTASYPDGPFEMPKKPDLDNVAKMVFDVFTNLGFWKDDSQVCGGEVRKWYVERGGKPGARISIEVNQCWPYKKARSNAARLSRPAADPIDDTCDPENVDSRGGSACSGTSSKRKEKLV